LEPPKPWFKWQAARLGFESPVDPLRIIAERKLCNRSAPARESMSCIDRAQRMSGSARRKSTRVEFAARPRKSDGIKDRWHRRTCVAPQMKPRRSRCPLGKRGNASDFFVPSRLAIAGARGIGSRECVKRRRKGENNEHY